MNRRFILFSPTSTTGLSIPYTSISLHAIQRPSQAKPASLFLQLLAQPQTFDDHDPDSTISITLIPAAAPAPPNPAETPASEPAAEARGEVEAQEPARLLYAALSACANLHPDPPFDNDDDEGDAQQSSANILFDGDRQDQDAAGIYPLSNGEGGVGGALPPPMPGSGGWITAENVGEFFDEAGNFRERRLGGGAGNVRGREEIVDGDVDGDGDGDGDGKDGGDVEDEGPKWRRTG